MKRRILAFILCTVMLLSLVPVSAQAAIKENKDNITFETFADLKNLAARDDHKCYVPVVYVGTKDIVISENITIPNNMSVRMYDTDAKLIIKEGVTLTLEPENELGMAGWISCDELEINGTVNAWGGLSIFSELVVNGTMNCYSVIQLGNSETIVEGYKNINFKTDDSGLFMPEWVEEEAELRSFLELAESKPARYQCYVDLANDVTITSDLEIPANTELVFYSSTLTVAPGVTLTNNGLGQWCGDVNVNGNLINNGDIYCIAEYGTIAFASTATYSGSGVLYVVTYESDLDYTDAVKGLTEDDITVTEPDFEHAEGYWEIRSKLKAPTIKCSADTASGKPKLSWSEIVGAEKYRIYRATSKSGTYSYLATSTGTSYIDTSAVAGTNYYYKVKALDTDTDTYSEYSNIVNRVCDLAKPTVSLSVNTSTGKPVVKWETVEGAAKYYVYRSTSKSSGYEKVYTAVSARTYTDTDAVAGTNYYYKVMAIHEVSAANSAYSKVVNRVCDLAKPTVTLTRTDAGNPWVKWKAIEDADGYEVWRSTSKSGTYKKVKTTVSATSFADRDVTEGTKYYYKVRAIHDTTAANSAYSAIKYITAK